MRRSADAGGREVVTVVLALRCADGLVMASDSQITDPVRGVSYPAQKLHALGKHAAWGGSGSRAVLYDLERIFDAEADAIVEAPDVGHALQQRVLPVLEHHYKNFISDVPGGKPGATPSTYVLAAGYAAGQPFIVDVDPHGLIGHHEETGFQAVGSGSPMAQQAYALLAHFQMTRARRRLRCGGRPAGTRRAGYLVAERRRPHGHLPHHPRRGPAPRRGRSRASS